MYKVERNNVKKLAVMIEKNELSTEIRNVCLETPLLGPLDAQIRAKHSYVNVLTPQAHNLGFTTCFDHGTFFN